jgi:16S rRNA (guanine1207-N2)-methyltransferase
MTSPSPIVERVRGVELRFRTRPGVFARKGLDDGSRLLVDRLELDGAALIADLGSGTGVIGMLCARLVPTAQVHLLDDHLRSVELARENVALNELGNVEVYLSDLFSAVPDARYSHVVSNPPAQLGNEFLEELVVESLRHLAPGGRLWLVVMKNLRPVFQRFLSRAGAQHETIASGRHHYILRGG